MQINIKATLLAGFVLSACAPTRAYLARVAPLEYEQITLAAQPCYKTLHGIDVLAHDMPCPAREEVEFQTWSIISRIGASWDIFDKTQMIFTEHWIKFPPAQGRYPGVDGLTVGGNTMIVRACKQCDRDLIIRHEEGHVLQYRLNLSRDSKHSAKLYWEMIELPPGGSFKIPEHNFPEREK